MSPRISLRLAEFRGGPLDDQVHLIPSYDSDPEVGIIEIVVDEDGVRTCLYEWTDIRGGGGVVYVFRGFRET